MDTTKKVFVDMKTFDAYADPSEGCIEIDQLIFPTIRELNQKGYITSACCCGHEDDIFHTDGVRAYVQFDFGEITPERLPEGWFWEDNGQQMEYKYQSFDTNGIRREVAYVMERLAEWAKELPDAK